MLADYHVHTEFSDDSEYPLADVCRDAYNMGLSEITITDHVDYGVKNDVGQPVLRYEDGHPVTNVDYARYFPALDAVRSEWDGRLFVGRGLELGVQSITFDEYNALLDQWESQMDFAILSIHQVNNLESWMGEMQKGLTRDEFHAMYWEEMLKVVQNFKRYAVMGHLDLNRRYDTWGTDYPFAKVKDIAAEVLRQVIADGRGIEVNTSGIRYGLGEFQPTADYLKLYRDLGGSIVTVGSDSHKPEHLGNYITEAYDLLRSLGFDAVYTYRSWEPIPNKL